MNANKSQKYFRLKFFSALAIAISSLFSCRNDIDKKEDKQLIVANLGKTIAYPYEYIGIKKEPRELDGKANVMRIYIVKRPVNFDSLKQFCIQEKRNWEDGVVNMVEFFDGKEYAHFPNNITGGYIDEDGDIDENTLKHVVAEYQYMSFNGWRKLTVYDRNAYESSPNEIDLRDN